MNKAALSKIKVMIFEDNDHLRDSLYFLISSSTAFTCVGMHSHARNLMLHIEKEQPELVIMDIEMPGVNGIDATRMIKERYPEIQILILTVFDDHARIFQCLCAGGSGYLLKTANPDQILQALMDVYNGGSPLTPSVAKRMVNFFQHSMPVASEQFNLTPKETEVMHYMVEGKSYKMSADAMGVGVETVKSHVKSIYRKLHVNNSTEAVAKALRYRLV